VANRVTAAKAGANDFAIDASFLDSV